MFGKNKQQETNNQTSDVTQEKQAPGFEHDKDINKEISIYTMPEKFRLNSSQLSKSKTMGIVIIIVGFIFICVLVFLVYWFALRSAPTKNDLSSDQRQNQTEFIPPVVDEIDEDALDDDSNNLSLDSLTELDQTDLATTTEEVLEPIATTTPEINFGNFDTDNDNLSDKEETLLGSNINEVDTDNDGYLDSSELENGYNPAGSGGLVDNAGISEYINIDFNYRMLYPVNWIKSSIGGNDSIIFRSEDNSFIQVIVQPNIDQEQITDWYERQFFVDSVATDKIIINEDWQGVKSEDETIVYLTDNDFNYIFVLSYNPGADEVFHYNNLFSAIINSFSIGLLDSE